MDDLNDYIFDIDYYQNNRNNSNQNIKNPLLDFQSMKNFDILDFIILDIDTKYLPWYSSSR